MKKLLILLLALPIVWTGCENTFVSVDDSLEIVKEYSYTAPQVENGSFTGISNVLDVKVMEDGSVKVYQSERPTIDSDKIAVHDLTANKIVGDKIIISEENTWFIPFNQEETA